MDAAQKSFEIQAQVRHNAEEFKNAINDLYNWQKDIKNQEKQMQQSQPKKEKDKDENVQAKPVRSQIQQNPTIISQEAEIAASSAQNTKNANNVQSKDSDSDPSKVNTMQDAKATMEDLDMKRKEAYEIKDKGNELAKLGSYKLASFEYTKAIDLYDQEVVFYTNRAFCYLKLEEYDACIKDCNQAIELDNLAVKAYYRRMLANESLGNNTEAYKDCLTVLTIDQNNTEAKRSVNRIRERLRNNDSSNFSSLPPNMIDIMPVEKPPHKRSSKSLKRILITDAINSKESKNAENLQISDEDIDKLFNSNCGTFEEIKHENKPNIIYDSTDPTTIGNNNETPISENIPNINTIKNTAETTTAANSASKAAMMEIVATNQPDIKPSEKIDTLFHKTEHRPLPPLPTSTAQFCCNWKYLSNPQKYEYLKKIPLNQLNKILGAGFDSNTLSEIIDVLYNFETDVVKIAYTLLELSKHRQLFVLSLLMPNKDRQALTEIVHRLTGGPSLVNSNIIEQIGSAFHLK